MPSLTIRNLESGLKERLRVRAARHGQSMEAEVRQILKGALARGAASPSRTLSQRIHLRFAGIGGLDLDLPPRTPSREPPDFE